MTSEPTPVSEQSQPFTCPVCRGAGTVSRPPHVAGDQPFWSSSATGALYPCRACTGTGIVWRHRAVHGTTTLFDLIFGDWLPPRTGGEE